MRRTGHTYPVVQGHTYPVVQGHEVTGVLKIAWEATGRVCSKLLAPGFAMSSTFLPELIESLERTSHR